MPKFMRGAKPTPRHKLAAAMPHEAVGPIPPQFLWLPKTPLSMWGNDVFGDCVTAEEAFAKGCAGIDIGCHKAVKWARRHWALNGAGLWEIMTLMQTDGFYVGDKQYDDGPFFSVDWTKAEHLKSAIVKGPVKLGVAGDQLDNVPNIGVSNGWLATGLTGGQQDHCVSLCGYGPMAWLAQELRGPTPSAAESKQMAWAMFTWSTIGIITTASLLAICGEAWVRNPTTVAKQR